jgi:hypothetical protein
MLPWHAGQALACDPPSSWTDNGIETEANEFAAELLMPTAWLEENRRQASSIPDLLSLTERAGTSAQSTCIALSRILPPGHLWAILDDDSVEASGRSPNSSVLPPQPNSTPDFERLARFASESVLELVAGRQVMWWKLEPDEVPQHEALDTRELLKVILDDHFSDPTARRKVLLAIGGIGGAAKSMAQDSTPASILGRLRFAFTRREDFPTSMLEDPRFVTWMEARARELAG